MHVHVYLGEGHANMWMHTHVLYVHACVYVCVFGGEKSEVGKGGEREIVLDCGRVLSASLKRMAAVFLHRICMYEHRPGVPVYNCVYVCLCACMCVCVCACVCACSRFPF